MKKILITDSLKSLLKMDGSILSKKNTRIFFAASGEKIIEIHKAENVDLIITALDLPGMNGDDAISTIRRDDVLRKVSTILICDNNKSSLARCKISGTNAFIMKPVQHEELFLNINKFLYVTERRNLRIILQVFINCKTSKIFFFAPVFYP